MTDLKTKLLEAAEIPHEREAREALKQLPPALQKLMKPIFDGSVRVVRERDTLLAENEALREALEPFGELWMAARSSHKDEPDNLGFYGFNGTNITVGDLRRARALTEKLSALEGEES